MPLLSRMHNDFLKDFKINIDVKENCTFIDQIRTFTTYY